MIKLLVSASVVAMCTNRDISCFMSYMSRKCTCDSVCASRVFLRLCIDKGPVCSFRACCFPCLLLSIRVCCCQSVLAACFSSFFVLCFLCKTFSTALVRVLAEPLCESVFAQNLLSIHQLLILESQCWCVCNKGVGHRAVRW